VGALAFVSFVKLDEAPRLARRYGAQYQAVSAQRSGVDARWRR
jgi:hypothetical protein